MGSIPRENSLRETSILIVFLLNNKMIFLSLLTGAEIKLRGVRSKNMQIK